MKLIFPLYLLFLLSTINALGKHLTKRTAGNSVKQTTFPSGAFENQVQPPLILFSCILMHHWSKQFEIPVLNGNLTITCLNNQSEINNTVTRLFAANNYSDNVLRDLQKKGQWLLAKNSILTVCSLRCARGRPVRRNRILPDSQGYEPDDVNFGCDDYKRMKCKELTSKKTILSELRKIFNLQKKKNITIKSAARCNRIIPYNRRVPCLYVHTKFECYRQGCCWDSFLKRSANIKKFRCYKSEYLLSQASALADMINRFTPRPSTSGAAARNVTGRHPTSKIYTTRRLSPKGPTKCGCKPTPGGSRRCPNSIPSRTNESIQLIVSKPLALKRLLPPLKRIYRGWGVEEKEWPWQAMIYFNQYLCGGTLISDRYIITAAHCVTLQNGSVANTGYVLLGVTNMSNTNSENRQIRRAAKVLRHEHFSLVSNIYPRNDLAIIKLDSKVDLSGKAVQPLCLPGPRIPRTSDQCFVTGFGRTSSYGGPAKVLQQACVPLVPVVKCQGYYQSGVLSGQNICAGKEKANSPDTCAGDSGGPLVCRRSGEYGSCGWYLAGVTSFGRSPCGSGAPSVYVNVFRYQSWIYQTIDRLNRQRG